MSTYTGQGDQEGMRKINFCLESGDLGGLQFEVAMTTVVIRGMRGQTFVW